ncbi:SHOCT domain-containing protein [Hymenobacter sp. BT683]|uniref:SHOCT domain-containing protein n=1 Tax=Hymenobacter jeongseonensis TaxID=2791027 RepID=A0ABS0ILD7_9BACT|nr:SHOCT domain-containing protein [Hymenobacter jeongseonensis]MBF9238688.1 SHOCT domain-containing protein [Hymenobacter jeongseonensis]
MENPSSPLDTLRQLKEMLDAGALTPTEFEALKQRLVFSEQALQSPPPSTSLLPAPAPFASVPPTAVPPALPPVKSSPTDYGPPVARPQQISTEPGSPDFGSTPAPAHQESLTSLGSPQPPVAGPSGLVPPATPLSQLIVESLNKAPAGSRPVPPAPVASLPPRYSEPSTVPPAVPPVLAEPPPVPEADPEGWTDDEFPESARPAARSPLALILSIGGLLALLGLVLYLSLNRPPSERLSSTSRTAADSVATSIEVGPQAEPLPPSAEAVPETIRVVPTNPAPLAPSRPAPVVQDSVAVTPAAPAPADSTDTP